MDRSYLSNRLPYPYTEESADWWLGMVSEHDGKDGIFRAIVADGKIVGNISVEQKSNVYCKDGEIGYPDTILKESTLYTSCAPCERCLCAIASLGIENIVFGVSYEAFSQLTPDDAVPIDIEGLLQSLGIQMKLSGPALEEEGMHVFEWWGGEHRPLEELIAEMAEVRKDNG